MFLLLASVLCLCAHAVSSNITATIISNAERDGINLFVLDIAPVALAQIESAYNDVVPDPVNSTAQKIDVHTHIVPAWFRTINPITGDSMPTPEWDIGTYLTFMQSEGVAHSVSSISSPGAGVFVGNKTATLAVARLLNEHLAAFSRTYPKRISFMAVPPLPFVQESLTEVDYALNTLKASGIGLMSNYEGMYLGNRALKDFFSTVNERYDHPILFVHPTDPVLEVNGTFIEANPTVYATGEVEYYFETARTFMDLVLTQTIQNSTSTSFIVPHTGGSFPSIFDRFIIRQSPAFLNASYDVFLHRLWWDSAGPTYHHQVSGLLGYGVDTDHLLFGTDFNFTADIPGNTIAVETSPLFSASEKDKILFENAKLLFGSKIDL